MAVCPNGHDSASDDFCDVCGMRIGGNPANLANPANPANPGNRDRPGRPGRPGRKRAAVRRAAARSGGGPG